jgi:O-antigen/teichoic acid export membrane protein
MSLYTSGRARRSLIDTISFRVVSQAATLISYVVMVRGMTKEDFGVLSLLYAFIPVVSTVASLGLEQALRRFQPDYLRAGNAAGAAWLVRFVASARFGANIVLLALIVFTWNHVAPVFKLLPYRAEFLILCVLILIHFQARILEIALSAAMLHRYSVGAMAVVAVSKLVAYSLIVWLDHLTVENVLVVDAVAFLIAYATMRRAYVRFAVVGAAGQVRYRPDAVQRRRLLRYGFFNNFNDAGTLLLNSRVDSFFIAAVLQPLSVGIYSFYTRLVDMTQNLMPTRFFEGVVQPMLFALPPAEADQKLPIYLSFLLNMNLLLLWPMFTYAIICHAEIVQIVFGGKFVEHSYLLPIIAAFALINSIAVPVTLVAQYEEKAGVILLSKVFGAVNVLGMLALLPVFGIVGAVIASGTAQAMKNGFIWWNVRQRGRWINGPIALLAGAGLWGIVVVLGFLAKDAVGHHPVVTLVVGAVLVAAAFLLHVRGPALSPSDQAILQSLLRGRESTLLRYIGLLPREVAPER